MLGADLRPMEWFDPFEFGRIINFNSKRWSRKLRVAHHYKVTISYGDWVKSSC
jgi:hypothetical protein